MDMAAQCASRGNTRKVSSEQQTCHFCNTDVNVLKCQWTDCEAYVLIVTAEVSRPESGPYVRLQGNQDNHGCPHEDVR
eukprot:4328447-Amphidinium_carterae.1